MGLGTTARRPVGQQMAYLRKRLLRSGGAAQTVSLGRIPRGSNIVRGVNSVRQAFDGTTPAFSLGVVGSLASIATSAAHGMATVSTAAIAMAAGAGPMPDASDIEVLATFTVTGGTTGICDIQLEFIPPDELPD